MAITDSRGTSAQAARRASAVTPAPRPYSFALRSRISCLIGSSSPSQTAARIRPPSCVTMSPPISNGASLGAFLVRASDDPVGGHALLGPVFLDEAGHCGGDHGIVAHV